MEMRGKRVLVCDCESTMPLQEGALTRACQAVGAAGKAELNTQLCRAQLGNFQRAIIGDQPVVVACTQEAPLFREIAEEDNPEATLDFVNIREAAGWSDEAKAATPKIAALLAAAAVEAEPAPLVIVRRSEGQTANVGDILSAVRSQDREDIARFYAAFSPVSWVNSVVRQIATAVPQSLAANARSLADIARCSSRTLRASSAAWTAWRRSSRNRRGNRTVFTSFRVGWCCSEAREARAECIVRARPDVGAALRW